MAEALPIPEVAPVIKAIFLSMPQSKKNCQGMKCEIYGWFKIGELSG
jgi:hypothetical protein